MSCCGEGSEGYDEHVRAGRFVVLSWGLLISLSVRAHQSQQAAVPAFTRGEVELGWGMGGGSEPLTSFSVKTAEFIAGTSTQWVELRYLTWPTCMQELFRATSQIQSIISYIHLGQVTMIQTHCTSTKTRAGSKETTTTGWRDDHWGVTAEGGLKTW